MIIIEARELYQIKGSVIPSIDQDRHAVGEIEAASDDQTDADDLGGFMGPDNADVLLRSTTPKVGLSRSEAYANSCSQDDVQKRKVRRTLVFDVTRIRRSRG
jgi:hypothetical protein